MMLNVKIYMHHQHKNIEHENQLNNDGQQEGLAPKSYRTKMFLREKRRQIKQKLARNKHDACGNSVPRPDTSHENDHTVETMRQKLREQAKNGHQGIIHKEQLDKLIGQIDTYYDSYKHIYDPVLQTEIKHQGRFR